MTLLPPLTLMFTVVSIVPPCVVVIWFNEPEINTEEVESWKWMKIEDIKEDMINNPDIYTIWFKIIFDEFYHYIEDHKI